MSNPTTFEAPAPAIAAPEPRDNPKSASAPARKQSNIGRLEKHMIGTLSMKDWEPKPEDVRRGLGVR